MEYTVNRVGDRYFDQTVRTGHEQRSDDLERIRQLGITRLRYPVLWERVALDDPGRMDWSWTDERLQEMQSLGIRPIAGLLHHGSGPKYTRLDDPAFPALFEKYARTVAERYPWVDAYTPINEPLTTARFSGLYGHWFPHLRDTAAFFRMLLNQCTATVLAMRAIRAVQPDARLIQTDDLGKTFSTTNLAYQAEYENERRWLTWDLLSGNVNRQHPMYGVMRSAGIEEQLLEWLVENPCPPDVIGVNHYLTSNRYLDDRTALYPHLAAGGNGRDSYIDIEAIRVAGLPHYSWGEILADCWQRYRRPLALTEVFLHCTREDQIRWLASAWEAALGAVHAGIEVEAVAPWSLFGSYDWSSLVTRDDGIYEPSAFDLRSTPPRATGLAHAIRQMAESGSIDHPLSVGAGWWERPTRFLSASELARAA